MREFSQEDLKGLAKEDLSRLKTELDVQLLSVKRRYYALKHKEKTQKEKRSFAEVASLKGKIGSQISIIIDEIAQRNRAQKKVNLSFENAFLCAFIDAAREHLPEGVYRSLCDEAREQVNAQKAAFRSATADRSD